MFLERLEGGSEGMGGGMDLEICAISLNDDLIILRSRILIQKRTLFCNNNWGICMKIV